MAPLVPGCCPPNMRHGDTLGLFPQRRKSATVKDAAEITAIATNTMMISRSSSRTWQSEHDWTCLATRQRENLTRFGHRQCRFFELGIHRCSWRDHCVAFKSATRDFRPVRNEPSSGGFFIARGNQMLWTALRSWWDSSVEANSTVLPCWAVGKSSCLPPLSPPWRHRTLR